MPNRSRRLLFLTAIAVNCVLWSQSRFSYTPLSHSRLATELSKRTSGYLPTSYNLVRKEQCHPFDFTDRETQCQHTIEHCPSSDTVLGISYLSSYFCGEPTLRPLIFSALLTWLVFLFSTLGISAADFFTPNLATLAELLGMDEDVAGVTFLAFGNGSPDLFSTFSAMRAQSGTLAVGELLGAASFIVSCVVGSMCIIKPFTVEKVPFLRDVGFFTVAVAMLLTTLWDGMITIWESVSLIVLYVVYVVIVIWGSWWDRRQAQKRRLESEVQSEYAGDSTPDSTVHNVPYMDEPSPSSPQGLRAHPTRSRTISSPIFPARRAHTLPRRASLHTLSLDYPSSAHLQMPSFSLLGALEFRQVVTSLQHQATGPSLAAFGSQHNPFAGGHYHPPPRLASVSPPGEIAWDTALGLAMDNRDSPHIALLDPLEEEEVHLPRVDTGDDADRTVIPSHSSDAPSDGDNESQLLTHGTRRDRFWNLLGRISHTLFPSLHQFGDKTLAGKIAAVFATPAVLALTLTLPVVVLPGEGSGLALEKSPPATGRLIEFEEEGIERPLIAEEEEAREEDNYVKLNKWLMVTQCVLGPLLASAVLFGNTKYRVIFFAAAALAGLVLAAVVLALAKKGAHTVVRMTMCLIGFSVAIVWIMVIADEVVLVLLTFGHIFGLSDAIIGLTIFAIGNSLADLVANTAVAMFAPIMGFSACFGGPMLNILLGIGISGTYITHQSSRPYLVDFSPALVTSAVALLLLLVSTLLFVPLNDYSLTKRWGIFLITSYMLILVVNVVMELTH